MEKREEQLLRELVHQLERIADVLTGRPQLSAKPHLDADGVWRNVEREMGVPGHEN